jgi:NADPH-dependent glutamate synthase beta subunit-like oxidoreductase
MPISPFSFDIEPHDLYKRDGLIHIHKIFLNFLKDGQPDLYQKLIVSYANPNVISDEMHEALCIDIAPFVEDFISYLFNIFHPIQLLQEQYKALSVISTVKRMFIQRIVSHQKREIPNTKPKLPIIIKEEQDFDMIFAKTVSPYLENVDKNTEQLEPYLLYALWAINTKEGKTHHKNSTLFKLPLKKTEQHLLKESLILENNLLKSKDFPFMTDSFSCTEKGLSLKETSDQTHYCIKCHPQKKDSCKRGFHSPQSNIRIEGCPLKEKISAFITVKNQGYSIGALAIICVDNPMVAATGKRICNDCKKACIYQKQEAVDVPGIESNVLNSVLNLPFGFEIYSLLTRWNPLNIHAPYPKAKTDYSVLVVGQGPAGIGLAHALMHEGVTVFAIDGLKIEALPLHLKDITKPIKHLNHLFQNLDTRKIYGFGGVSEYGITIRWDKNNLLVLRLILERNALYTLEGGVLYGSQLTEDQALNEYGFDHIALCTGAGSPKYLSIHNQFPKGVRFASDFLMNLQLTGAFKKDSVANLTIDLPIVVIGAGLTAIDSATEALRYYLRQIQKTAERIKKIKDKNIFDIFFNTLTDEEKEQLTGWLEHATELENQKKYCIENNVIFNAVPLLQKWGGSQVVYRKSLDDAPSVKQNADEVQHAFKEGIFFKENFTPLSFQTDKNNSIQGILGKIDDREEFIPAKTILIAIGTENITLN